MDNILMGFRTLFQILDGPDLTVETKANNNRKASLAKLQEQIELAWQCAIAYDECLADAERGKQSAEDLVFGREQLKRAVQAVQDIAGELR